MILIIRIYNQVNISHFVLLLIIEKISTVYVSHLDHVADDQDVRPGRHQLPGGERGRGKRCKHQPGCQLCTDYPATSKVKKNYPSTSNFALDGPPPLLSDLRLRNGRTT